MATLTAQNLLDYNNYIDISTANVEALADVIIDYINMQTGQSIAVFRDQAGAVGSRTITVTGQLTSLVIIGAGLMMRQFKERGPNVSIGGITATAIVQDPQFQFFTKLLDESINRLRGRGFERT